MIDVHFTNLRQNILDCLDKAETEILVAVYWFTNTDLFDKLCQKLEKNVSVQLIISNDYINNRVSGLDFQKFINLGGKFYFTDSETQMHNNFCIIDNKVLINGSYNWTYMSENKNYDNILIIKDDNQTISAFYNEFFRLKNKLTIVSDIDILTLIELKEPTYPDSRDYLINDVIFKSKEIKKKK